MNTNELLNTLNIIQTKIKQCQEQKREITRKMTRKQALLNDSQNILRNDLQHALEEDFIKKNTKISNNQHLKLNHVHGWIRDKLCLNKGHDLNLFLTFDYNHHLSSLPPNQFQIYCIYDYENEKHVTEAYPIEWKSPDDLTWLSLSISHSILQAYFPCHISIIKDELQNTKNIQFLNDKVAVTLDQTVLIHYHQTHVIDLYGLSMSHILSSSLITNKHIITNKR
ncbi:uncharacterized protein BX663DRAFT_522576, partial [Cokeromyces recurvatus]